MTFLDDDVDPSEVMQPVISSMDNKMKVPTSVDNGDDESYDDLEEESDNDDVSMTFLDIDPREVMQPQIPFEDNKAKVSSSVDNGEDESYDGLKEESNNGISTTPLPGYLPGPLSNWKSMFPSFLSLSLHEKARMTMLGAILWSRVPWMTMLEEIRREKTEADIQHFFHMVVQSLIAYVLFCAILTKISLRIQFVLKYSFGKVALLLLWTSGDVEKHPGPSLDDIRQLTIRLVKKLQGNKVVNWGTVPPFWDQDIVLFQDINNMKDSDNYEKYAMFYEALAATIKRFGHIPDWCRDEMTYVENGNAPELQKCKKARKIREIIEHNSGSEQDTEDIFRRAGYPRQVIMGGNIPAQAVIATQPLPPTNGIQQRMQKCPFNVPSYQPIAAIKDDATARRIAEGCMAKSKNAGKNGHGQTKTQKRSATTTSAQPAPKQLRVSANSTTQQATIAVSVSSPMTTSAQHTLNGPGAIATTPSRRLPVTSTIVRPTTTPVVTAVATTSPAISNSATSCRSQHTPSVTMTVQQAARNTPASGPSANLISLPSDDLDDLGFSSGVDLDQFVTQIMKDDAK